MIILFDSEAYQVCSPSEETSQLERSDHLVGLDRILDGVEIVTADAVRVHDLPRLESQLA